MQTTNNIGLRKPGENDFINVKDLNHNADILDSKVKEALDKTVEVINELDSSETNKALSAAQGKELKRLIDEVPQVEVVDNMTTNNRQKALSAAQGVEIAEQLKKSGLKIVSATFSSNQIRVTGDFEAQADVPFLLDLTTTSLSFDSNTNIRIGSSVLALKDFTGSALESIENVGQRQFLCVKKSNYIAIELFQSKLEKRTNEAFQSARDGKIKLADAITSKGQVVDNEASFESMANKIRGIKTGIERAYTEPVRSPGVYRTSDNGYGIGVIKLLEKPIPPGDFYIKLYVNFGLNMSGGYGWSYSITFFETENDAKYNRNGIKEVNVKSIALNTNQGRGYAYLEGTFSISRPLQYARIAMKHQDGYPSIERVALASRGIYSYDGYGWENLGSSETPLIVIISTK